MNEDNFQTLLTAIIELKMDPTTMKDWQCSNREHKEVPPCSDQLDFIDLQACDSENSVRDVAKKGPTASYPGKKTTKSYMVSMEDSCMACNKDNHSLYGCNTFIALSPNKREWIFSGTVVCVSIA